MKTKKEILKSVRIGIRLDVPSHKIIKDKTKYNRKKKHKKSYKYE